MMMEARQRRSEQQKQKIEQCTFPAAFTPNPGGQQTFFDMVPCDRAVEISERWIYLKGGLNSGKSTSGAAFACSRAKLDPKARGLITANTYGQLETSTLIALIEFCKHHNIPLTPTLEDTEETAKLIANRRLCRIFGAPVLVLSAEVFTGRTEDSREVGRGLQVRWIWGDELAYADESAFTTMNGRLGRGEGYLKGLGLITSSINKNNPYNYCYNLFDDPDRADSLREQFLSIKCATYENIHADRDYVQSLKNSLTAELYIIEVEGDYAAATANRVYEQFDRRFNACDTEPQPHDRLHIGMDFNVGRMAAVVHVIDQQLPRAVDEFHHLKDTPAMIAAIKERYPEHDQRGLITIYPDASGRKTSSANASVSDLALLQAAGFIVVVNSANPSVRDRVNSMNVAFCNAAGDRRYLVNVKRCPFYTKALEQQVLVNGEPDKKHGLDDVVDSAGYFVAKILPVSSIRAKTTVVGKPRFGHSHQMNNYVRGR